MAARKPDDETMKGLPAFADPNDSFIGGKSANPSSSHAALTGIGGPAKPVGTETAPEVSQGAWRERAFTPRGVMPKADVRAGLETALRHALSQANHPRVAWEELRQAWLPLLRQALEQAGGDGLDAWLERSLKGATRVATVPLFEQLSEGMTRLRAARELAGLEEDALKLIELVFRALDAPMPRRLSFKQMERELEGKLEVDELLQVRFGDDAELRRRLAELGSTMESLREQIKRLPGKQPGGMYANFVRLKAEVRVLDAELRRREPR
jgi:hypothetical protein